MPWGWVVVGCVTSQLESFHTVAVFGAQRHERCVVNGKKTDAWDGNVGVRFGKVENCKPEVRCWGGAAPPPPPTYTTWWTSKVVSHMSDVDARCEYKDDSIFILQKA